MKLQWFLVFWAGINLGFVHSSDQVDESEKTPKTQVRVAKSDTPNESVDSAEEEEVPLLKIDGGPKKKTNSKGGGKFGTWDKSRNGKKGKRKKGKKGMYAPAPTPTPMMEEEAPAMNEDEMSDGGAPAGESAPGGEGSSGENPSETSGG